MRSLHIKLFVVIEDIFLQNPGLGTFSNKQQRVNNPTSSSITNRERDITSTNILKITSSFIKQQQK